MCRGGTKFGILESLHQHWKIFAQNFVVPFETWLIFKNALVLFPEKALPSNVNNNPPFIEVNISILFSAGNEKGAKIYFCMKTQSFGTKRT